MGNDTTYVKTGDGTKEKIETSILGATCYNDAGFEFFYQNGIRILTKKGILYLAFIMSEYIQREELFNKIFKENQLERTVRRGITNIEINQAETGLPFARKIYDILGGDNLLSGNEKVGLQIDNLYEFTINDKEEDNQLRNILGLELKLIGRKGAYPIIRIENKDIKLLRDQKKYVAELSKRIVWLSEWIMNHYESVIMLKEKIVKDHHNKILGGN